MRVFSISGKVLEPDLEGSPLLNTHATIGLRSHDGKTKTATLLNRDGSYSFDKVKPGRYFITLFPITDYTIVEDTDSSTPAGVIALYVKGSSYGNNFAVEGVMPMDEEPPPVDEVGDAIISGIVRVGNLQDGIRFAGGATITLMSPDLSSTTTTTNHDGFYSFSGLSNGVYVVVLSEPDGYEIVDDSADDANPTDGIIRPTVADQMDSTDNNFAIKQYLADISGTVYLDNLPSAQSSPEVYRDGAVVTLKYPDDSTERFTTDTNGFYSFTDLPLDTYEITLTAPSGFILADPLVARNVMLTKSGSTENDFAIEVRPTDTIFVYDISGAVRVIDENGFGIRRSTVTLVNTDTNQIEGATMTAEDGTYSFTGVEAGNYMLRQTNSVELNYISVGDTDGANDDLIMVDLMSANSIGNNFYDDLDCQILDTLPPIVYPDCFDANPSLSPDLPLFTNYQWLTESDEPNNLKMVTYDPPRFVEMNGIYKRANQNGLRNNIRLFQDEVKMSFQNMTFWSNAETGINSMKDMDIRNEGNEPHLEESAMNKKVDVFRTRFSRDSDCCSTNNPVQEYYVYGIAEFLDNNDMTQKCEVRVCYALIE